MTRSRWAVKKGGWNETVWAAAMVLFVGMAVVLACEAQSRTPGTLDTDGFRADN